MENSQWRGTFSKQKAEINFILLMKEFIPKLRSRSQLNEKRECHSLLLISEQNGTISNFENEIEENKVVWCSDERENKNLTRKMMRSSIFFNDWTFKRVLIFDIWPNYLEKKSWKAIFPAINLVLINTDSMYWTHTMLF